MSNLAISHTPTGSKTPTWRTRILQWLRLKPKEEPLLVRSHNGLVSVLERVDRELFAEIKKQAERAEDESSKRNEPRDTIIDSPPTLLQTITAHSQGGATVRFLNDLGAKGYSRPRRSMTLVSGDHLTSRGDYLSAAKGYISSLARRVVYDGADIHSEEVAEVNKKLFETLHSCILEDDFDQAQRIIRFFFNSWYKVIVEQQERAGKAYLLVCALNAPFLFSVHASIVAAQIRKNESGPTNEETREVIEAYLNSMYIASFASTQFSVSKIFVQNSRGIARNSQGHLMHLMDSADVFNDVLLPVIGPMRDIGFSYTEDLFSADNISERAQKELHTIHFIQERLGLRNPFTRFNCEKLPEVRVGRA